MQLRIKINLDDEAFEFDDMGELLRIFADLPRVVNNALITDERHKVLSSDGFDVGSVYVS